MSIPTVQVNVEPPDDRLPADAFAWETPDVVVNPLPKPRQDRPAAGVVWVNDAHDIVPLSEATHGMATLEDGTTMMVGLPEGHDD